MLDYLNPEAMSIADIGTYLDDLIETMLDREYEAVAGRRFATPTDLIQVVIDHAERVVPTGRINHKLLVLGRFGLKTGIRLHLIYDRPLERLALVDFGTAVLRNMAADGPTVSITDRDGVTLADLVHR